MSDILVLVLRRLRAPLITLIAVYAIAIFGLVLMPGTDPSGQPWRLSVFDAFYVRRENGSRIEEPDEIERLEARIEAVLAQLD